MLQETTSNHGAQEAEVTVLDFQLKCLLDFLSQKAAQNPVSKDHRMVCPWDGVPLPSVDIMLGLSPGSRATLQLSHELSMEFIKYMLALTSQSEITD